MSRFYVSLEGQARTGAARRGSTDSGVNADVRGWHVGAQVYAHDNDGADQVNVYMTAGSAGYTQEPLLTIEEGPDGPMVTDVSDWLRERVAALS